MLPEPPARFRATLVERLGFQRFLSPVGRIIIRNLERKPIQAIMTTFGIALAIGMLVVGRYVTDAMQYMVDVQYRQVQRDDVTIVFNEPRPARVQYEVAHLPGVLRSELFRAVPVTLRFEHHKYRIALTGVSPQGELRRLLDRHLHPVDLPLNGVVLTTKLAEILGVHPGDAIAAEVLEGSRPI
jgi:putative ABC transport system permease protein